MIKVTLVLALGLSATMMFRRRSAAFRHWVLAATILGAAVMPLAEMAAPAWQLPILPAPAVRLAPPLALGDATDRVSSMTTTVMSEGGFGAWAILPTVRAVWLVGFGVSLLLLAVGIARLLVVASRASLMTDGRWVAEAAALAERARMARTPEILRTSHPTLLFTWGLRQPKVLVPRDASTWSDERIRIVLGHELAHVQRGDWAVLLLADCVRSAYWFNPLVWIACWRLRLESEHACDDAVLRLGVAAPDYATQLLDLARLFRRSRRSFFPAPAMARPSDLERRVRVMLNTRMDRSPVGRLSGWLVALGLVALTVPIAGLSMSAAGTANGYSVPPAAITLPSAAASPVAEGQIIPGRAATVTPPAPVPSVPRTPERQTPPEDSQQSGAWASLAVSIVDQLGRSVPGAVVGVSNPLVGLNAEGRTGDDGHFAVSEVPAGDVQLTVSKPGFKTHKMSIKLEPSTPTAVRVTLQLGMLAEMVIVNAQAGVAPAVVGSARPGVATPTGTIAPQARRVGSAPTEDPCSQSTEGGCLTPPRKLVNASPIYPAWAIEAGTSGTVVLQGKVRTDGKVGSLQPAPEANGNLAKAAMDAVGLWEFSPVRLNGVPMEVDLEVTVKFEAVKK